jgi:DNA-directed RNA polymerase specialized sigma24 family protein
MFRQYRNDYWEPAPSQTPTNALDAADVQKVMKDLPESHRIAVQWCYISRSGPTAICQRVGTNREGLMKLIVDGRSMLKNLLAQKETA